MATRDYIRLLRVHQWYKNFLVFLAIIFAEVPKEWPWTTVPALFRWSNYPPLILGFLSFCAVSSAVYIFNDVKDIEEDAQHPEKRHRPLPSGAVSRRSALILGSVLMIVGLTVAFTRHPVFFVLVILYIINSQLYNYYLRKWAIVDVVAIAVGFIIRAISGAFLLEPVVPFTSWLVIGVFFVALVLGFGKRKNELQYLGQDAAIHKQVFIHYTDEMLNQGITMSATWVVLFYALYTYENFRDTMTTQPVMMTVPIVAGIVMRYVYLIFSGSPVGRKPHLAIRDKGILIGGILFFIVLVWTLFFWEPFFDWFYDVFRDLFPPMPPLG
ncbi:MAG: UbiA prenyltransferase family protein [Candidatus Thorarchaeota archaeon]|nr:UbiA prenyltransferase family protein [Candidatus Thorarchaeota archaeon]